MCRRAGGMMLDAGLVLCRPLAGTQPATMWRDLRPGTDVAPRQSTLGRSPGGAQRLGLIRNFPAVPILA
jgi:hypothetical protein